MLQAVSFGRILVIVPDSVEMEDSKNVIGINCCLTQLGSSSWNVSLRSLLI